MEGDARPPQKDFIEGTLPRWFSVLLLALLAWLVKNYAANIDKTLADHSARLQAVELWRAAIESTRK